MHSLTAHKSAWSVHIPSSPCWLRPPTADAHNRCDLLWRQRWVQCPRTDSVFATQDREKRWFVKNSNQPEATCDWEPNDSVTKTKFAKQKLRSWQQRDTKTSRTWNNAFMLAPASIRRRKQSVRPRSAARINGVWRPWLKNKIEASILSHFSQIQVAARRAPKNSYTEGDKQYENRVKQNRK